MTRAQSSHFLQVRAFVWIFDFPLLSGPAEELGLCTRSSCKAGRGRGSSSDSCSPEHLPLNHQESVAEAAGGCRHLAGMGITPLEQELSSNWASHSVIMINYCFSQPLFVL